MPLLSYRITINSIQSSNFSILIDPQYISISLRYLLIIITSKTNYLLEYIVLLYSLYKVLIAKYLVFYYLVYSLLVDLSIQQTRYTSIVFINLIKSARSIGFASIAIYYATFFEKFCSSRISLILYILITTQNLSKRNYYIF